MIHLKCKNSKTLGEETNSLNSMSNEWNTKQYIHTVLNISLSSGEL